jgi:hypothetical protein
MSKQLAISSTFATFAMACMVLLYTEDRAGLSRGEPMLDIQAEAPSLELPSPSFLPVR